jgi:Ala-tRNA(Pro) deacylase
MNNDFDKMPTSAANLYKKLDALGIQYQSYDHEPVFTVAESEKIDAQIPSHHTRNMFLRTKKKQNYLVTLSHNTPIDLKKLNDVLECGRFSFGSSDRLFEILCVYPGSLTPLSAVNTNPNDITIILEQKMMNAKTIAVHPLRNDKTITITPKDLLKLLQSYGHQPHVIDLTMAAPEIK